jgi:hypothetical protein
MRFPFLQSRVVCTAVLALAAGCGGGDDAVGPDGLSGTDVNSMVDALNVVGAFSFDLSLIAGQPLTSGLGAQSRTTSIDRDVACAGGGVIHMSGIYEAIFSGAQGAYSVDVAQQHDRCEITTPKGRRWTFDGQPSVTLHVEYIINSSTHVIRMLGSSRGSFAWTSESGLAGSCDADVKLSANGVPATRENPGLGVVTGQITGHICGRYVDVHY